MVFNKSKQSKSFISKTIHSLIFLFFFFSCDDFSFFALAENSYFKINPKEIVLYANEECVFTGINGSQPFVFRIVSGLGSIDISTGLYTAPVTKTNDIILLTDAEGFTDTATVFVIDKLEITPVSLSMLTGSTQVFTVNGGMPPYTFILESGVGVITPVSSNSVEYSALGIAGTAVVRVTDSLSNIEDANITISVSGSLMINPTNAVLSISDTVSFVASGGDHSYTYEIYSESSPSPGTINPVTGLYTATATGTAVIRVTDGNSDFVDATVLVNSAEPLLISPSSIIISPLETYTFSASGGKAPYTFYLEEGESGTIDPNTGLYTAPAYKDNKVYVSVEDDLGTIVTARVKIK